PQPLRVNLLDDEWHGQDEPWADLAERLENDLGRGRLREKRDRAAGRERKQKLEGTAERVREREKGDDRVSRLEGHVVPREDDVREQAPVRKHHPFGETGRPRRVDDRRESLVLDSRELKALGRFLYAARFPSRHEDVGEASREALLPAMESPEIRQREDGRDVAQLFRVERGEEGVRHEEKDGVGAEIGKDRDDDRAVRDAGQPDDCPARGIPPEKGDLVSGPDTANAEDLVQPRDLVRHLPVRQPFSFPVRECGACPVPPHALSDETDEVLLLLDGGAPGFHGNSSAIVRQGSMASPPVNQGRRAPSRNSAATSAGRRCFPTTWALSFCMVAVVSCPESSSSAARALGSFEKRPSLTTK